MSIDLACDSWAKRGRDGGWHVWAGEHPLGSGVVIIYFLSIFPCSGWSQSGSAVPETAGCWRPPLYIHELTAWVG